MKIAIVGGGSVRTPLLVNGLAGSDLPIDEIALFDTDTARLDAIGSFASTLTPAVRVYRAAEACLSGAAFVILSIRAGGIAARARDEAVAIVHGVVGQETVGPGGFAMAMRNVPPAVHYANLAAKESPDAWVINFTNPVGIVTQAMTSAGHRRTIGICDTPTELFEDVAHVLGIESSRCWFDYFGLNHLGWLREVYCDGRPRLAALWDREELLRQVYRTPLFDPPMLRSLRLLPTEYLYYYYSPERALDHVRRAGTSRGASIVALNDSLFAQLASPNTDRRSVYERYLASRSAGYMQIESGAPGPVAPRPWADATGYDRIAIAVIRAIHTNSHAILPLDVANRGSIRDVGDDEIVEVPCVVTANGARPLAVGPLPQAVAPLLLQVKEYERLTVDAALSRARDAAVAALARNPLVPDSALAAALVDALQPW